MNYYADRENLDRIYEDLKSEFKIISDEVSQDAVIGDSLDDEAQRIPALHSKWMVVLTTQANTLTKLKTIQKKLYLERWKYYQKKMPDKYYHIHGQVHDKIMKTDLDRYITSDDYICLITEIVEYQKKIVEFVEKATKDIGNRGFYLRDMIEWRKFESGA